MSEKQNEIMLAKHADVHQFLKDNAEQAQRLKSDVVAYKKQLPKKKEEWTQKQRGYFEKILRRSKSNRKFISLLEEFEE